MYAMLILVAILVYPLQALANEPLTCFEAYEIPQPIKQHIEAQKGVAIEIREQDTFGYISELFYNKILIRGWLFVSGTELVACEIDFALELDEEGKVLFAWDASLREM